MTTSKLALNVEDLNVDSFATASAPDEMMASEPILTIAGPTQNIKDSCIVGSCHGSCYTCEPDCWM